MIQKNFCTTGEAADLLGMSVSTVQLWVESGILQAWKTAGGHRRVLRDSVDALLPKKPNAGQSPAVLRPFRVLVVEDDAYLLRLYQANLTSWPMHPEVKLIDNANSAVREVVRRRPDLLIADLQMPGMDGFRMLRALFRRPEMLSGVSIVAVTGLDESEIARRGGVPAGVQVMHKPIPFDRLLALASSMAHPTRGLVP